jgi:RNA polymerase sigma-70 factor (ECF subfamily)
VELCDADAPVGTGDAGAASSPEPADAAVADPPPPVPVVDDESRCGAAPSPLAETTAAADAAAASETRDGSPRHLWATYDRTVARLRRVAYRVLHDEHEAEDAAHDAFVSARASLDRLRDPALLENWLIRIAKNAAATRLRRRKRMTPDHRVVAEEPPEGWELPRVRFRSGSTEPPPDAVAAVRSALESVPETWRSAFLARVLRGRSIPQIADEQGVSPACVKTRISRVRSRLRRSI